MRLLPRLWTRSLLAMGMVVLVAQGEPARHSPRPLPVCTDEQVSAALNAVRSYTPSAMQGFVTLQDGALTVHGQPYGVRGINYYPSRYPWRRFLRQTPPDALEHELALMQDAGFNTLRLFLWNEALFQCEGSGAVPQAGTIHRLDGIIHAAAAHGFRLIVTLNDLPDLTDYPLYDSPPHNQAQTAYLVTRYRDEPAVLAWDLRNEGDIDYGTHFAIRARSTREQVLRWLGTTTQQVRALDPNHLLTAGWLFDAEATAPYVDFISFHHWTSAADLSTRIAAMRAETDKPILLEEFGYSTQRVTPDEQAAAIVEVATTAEESGLLGWMVWAAFDFPIDQSCYPTPCLSPDNGEHYFGLWTTDYTPKPAIEALTSVLAP